MMSGSPPRVDVLSPEKQALVALRRMKARLEEIERAKAEPIAVIGLGCRFPGAASPDAFWRLLDEGRDAIREVPPERWDAAAYYDPDPDAPGKAYTRWGGFIDEVDRFDAPFFGISPREAEKMDPQQRLLLEVAWEALEHAGQAPDRLARTQTGVFIGVSSADYLRLFGSVDGPDADAYWVTGNTPCFAAGRLSYLLGLQGPSLVLDTACSASLTAVHLACHSLRAGECRMAIAGGVNLMLVPEVTILLSKARMLAPDGRCKTFDAAADGYGRGEGCGLVVLKRLSHAHADGDRVLAFIRGSAVNQDGRSSGITVPNGPAQESVIRQALASGGVEPGEVDYVEAHGTGTSLGDPIELRALGAVLSEHRPADRPVIVGSVKTNIGHLEAAAGIAGLIKTVLALQHERIPQHLHLRAPNPHIPWSELPIVVASRSVPWPRGNRRRLAGVSSFGASGTNAHIVLEEAPDMPDRGAFVDRPAHLLTLSARTPGALRTLAGRWADRLSVEDDTRLGDVCFTANAGRAQLPHRLALVAASIGEAQQGLAALAEGAVPAAAAVGEADETERPRLVFLFTGQGAQYAGMGRELYETQPVFRRALERCGELLRDALEVPLLSVLYPEPGGESRIDETLYTQPALFAFEYALTELLKSWGVEPDAVLGHSVGEYVAAYAAGVLGLDDALALVAGRARLMQGLPRGAMAAVFANEARVRRAVEARDDVAAIAAINGPENVVISGAADAIDAICGELAGAGVRARRLTVSHAFHSPLVEPMLEELERIASRVAHGTPQIPLASNLTGEVARDGEFSPRYWRRHARAPVRFAAGLDALHRRGYRLFVEVGPQPMLCTLGQRCLAAGSAVWAPLARKGRGDWQQILETIRDLYVNGVNPNWEAFDAVFPRRRMALPTYPFERRRYWAAGAVEVSSRADAAGRFARAVEAGAWQSQNGPLDLGLDTYAEKWRCLERLTTGYIVAALRDLGAFTHTGEGHSAESLLRQCGILPGYRKLLSRWLARLTAEGVLEQQGDTAVSPEPLNDPDLSALWRQAEALADVPLLVEYVRRCGGSLAAVLTGKQSALETLFPGGSSEFADWLYGRAPAARYLNGTARAVAAAFASDGVNGSPLRVLEIGAGTGSTTSIVLPALPRAGLVYWFTDVSEFFLGRAEARFRDYGCVRFGLLDIERSPQTQGYAAQSFDLVIATNVLHTASNLRAALQHVRTLLSPDGLLVLAESTIQHAFYDITVGLVEGWQRFEDDLRGDNPLLSVDEWRHALREVGFERVSAFPERGSPAELLGQSVIVAQAPAAATYSSPIHEERVEMIDGGRSQAAQAAERDAPDLLERLNEAMPAEREELLIEYVRSHVARVLRLDASDPPDRRRRLMDLGLDSLMAVELRNRLAASLGDGVSLPATLIFDYPSIESIARYIGRQVLRLDIGDVQPGAAPSAGTGDLAEAAARLAALSEEEAGALLLEKLERL